MTVSQCQFSLCPERGNQFRAALHGTQPSSGEVADLVQRTGTEVTDLMGLQVSPEIFHRVEFRCISRQELQLNVHVLTFYEVAHDLALMRLEAIPDDEQRPRDLTGK